MRTKTLLLAAALSAAGVASSMAQVYSANAVGYVNLALQAGYNLIANPLNGTNNHLNTILPLPDTANETTVFRFRPATQNFDDAVTFLAGFGWFAGEGKPESAYIINPGEGFFIRPAGPTPLNVTFVGEVPQGSLSNPIIGGNNYSIVASQVPQALPLGAASQAGTLMFPSVNEDVVFIYDVANQRYFDAFTYIAGFGWFQSETSTVGPEGPIIPVGNSFFVQKKGANTSWTRTFSVN